MEGLIIKFANALQECLDSGMEPPFIVAVIGANGSCQNWRYDVNEQGDGLAAKLLTQHSEAGGMALPLNFVVVDAAGNAVRVLFRKLSGDEPSATVLTFSTRPN